MSAQPSTAHRTSARDKVRALLDHGHGDEPTAFTHPLSAPFALDPPEGWLWDGSDPHPASRYGLRDPRAYTSLADGDLAAFLHQPTSAALGVADSPVTTFTEQQIGFIRRSADITMKGGTTSGVVYPLAVCEIARRFRLRNVGGASAGAIAASFAAAAEIGRAGSMNPRTRQPLAPLDADQPAPVPGRARPGFVGLADVAAWFTQADARPGSADEFRIGQLFKPTSVARPLFRVIVAMMRSRFAQLPVLITGALGLASMIATIVVILLAPFAAADWRRGPTGAIISYPLAMGWLLALSLIIIGGVVLGVLIKARFHRTEPVPPELDEPVEHQGPPPSPSLYLASVSFGGGIALAALLAVGADHWAHVSDWRMLFVWLVMVLTVVGIQVAAIWVLITSARQHRFGLVSGANPTVAKPDSWWNRSWDSFAGAPRPTVEPNLMDWMNTGLSDLAGLPDAQVLRFGHLWFGAGYTARGAVDDAGLTAAATLPRDRLVNLELMTSELVHGISMRFPLRPRDVRDDTGRPLIFLRRSDLEGPNGLLLPLPVIDALCSEPAQPARDVSSGELVTDLHPMPMPWDLPVLFAVRLSMALPALFQSIRMYRNEVSRVVRDDFGARITRDNQAMCYPPSSETAWVQELWMSDGGITSNFPIHFFDNPLPLWPTLGINLGKHPRGFGHQDVWLPSDAQARTSVPGLLGRSMLSFGAAVFNTAMSWRDTSQTFMPAFRGRVAWVRQRSDEGGSNLFMDRERISALALRGAMAGARLSRRFAADGHWRRHQWLRMRVSLGNLSSLESRTAVSMAEPVYQDILANGWAQVQRIQAAMAGAADPNPAVPTGGHEDVLPWFEPQPRFWTDAGPTVASLVTSPGADPDSDLNRTVPTPAPDLRQVPPT